MERVDTIPRLDKLRVSFSATHTALRLVIPVALRGEARSTD